jgi:hypothetical protein
MLLEQRADSSCSKGDIRRTTMTLNEYRPADSHEIGAAAEVILGGKPTLPPDTIVNDPDLWHRPEAFAQFDE